MKTKFGNKRVLNQDFVLQITSMADVFVILLVFLLKSYSLSIVNLAPSEGNTLPEASSPATIRETLKVEIKADAILVDAKPIMKLKNFNLQDAAALADDGSSEILLNALKNQRKPNPLPNMDSNLLVMADEHTPYTTLEAVMASAAMAGFVDLQLVVVNPD